MSVEIETKSNAVLAMQAKRKEMQENGTLKAPEYLTPTQKAKANPKSRALAIDANCYECVGGNSSEGYKRLVRDCGLEGKCSLWPHRPWQDVKGEYKGPEE